jgi:aldehyde:ferredoxin oxidoreductase
VAMHAGVIPFGDGEGAIHLVEGILEGSEIGTVLAQGARATGKYLNCDHVPVVKGQAIPAYDPRAVKGMGVTYATSPMGADHTAGYAVTTNILDVGGSIDPLHVTGQAELSRKLQIATAAIDSINVCLFTAFAALDTPEMLKSLVAMVNARHGWDMTIDNLMEMGMEILRREKLFNSQAGFTEKDDRLPGFFYTEKLPPHNHTFDVPDEELDGLLDS